MKGLIKNFKVDKLNVYVFDSREDMGYAAYLLYKDKMSRMLATQSQVRAIFAAAHSQNDFLAPLAADKEIDFSRVEAFHMDEYMGLGRQAPQNFGNFLSKAIFSHQPFAKVNLVDSDAKDIDAECRRYEALLKQAPLDIVSMGVGENGHIAFNDPHEANFNDPHWVRITSLDVPCRQQQVNDGEFKTITEVPQSALTLTIPALMSCRSIVCIVPLERKAWAINKALTEPVSEECPASILRTHDDATLFIDKGAAMLL